MSENLENRISSEQAKEAIYQAHLSKDAIGKIEGLQSDASEIDNIVTNGATQSDLDALALSTGNLTESQVATIDNLSGLEASSSEIDKGLLSVSTTGSYDFSILKTITPSDLTTLVVKEDCDLLGESVTIPSGVTIIFNGGIVSNGIITLTGNEIRGLRGFNKDITISGYVQDKVLFDWFVNEKLPISNSSYTSFMNGNNPTFGTIPTISENNRIILEMLINQKYPVYFGSGIYPFDDELTCSATFLLYANSRKKTLLWCPSSAFMHYSSGGATHPEIKNISIEAWGEVILTDAWSTNAFHGLLMDDVAIASYNSHTFLNDYSTTGGTGCPIYGSKIVNSAFYAGQDKGCFYGWGSASNVYDNVTDLHYYFGGQTTTKKCLMKSIFYNSNVKLYTNSNIAYGGMDYVYYVDRGNTLFYFTAKGNLFENNSSSFKAICYVNATSSNINFKTSDNTYIGSPKESAYHYVLLVGNIYFYGTDSPTPIYNNNTLRNYSGEGVNTVTIPIDSSQTKSRLSYYEPYSSNGSKHGTSTVYSATSERAGYIGLQSVYDLNPALYSFIQVTRSTRNIKPDFFYGHGFGNSIIRPTTKLIEGYFFFDTTLNKPIWYNGTDWVDSSGTIV